MSAKWDRISTGLNVAAVALLTYLGLHQGWALLAWVAGLSSGLLLARLLIAVFQWKARR